MSPFGSNYSWRTTMSTITYYAMRRILGALARLLERWDRREQERRANLRAHPEGPHARQRHATGSGRAQNPKSDRGCMCPQIGAQETK